MRILFTLLAAYLLGAMPIGYLLVKLFKHRDVRELGSGRTGSTNVFRAGGIRLALVTGILDVLKAATAVWLTQWLLPNNHWVEVLAGSAAILGHNYSVFIKFKGGAGGGPAVGGAMGLWPWSVLIVVPIGAVVWYGIGYASLTTISFAIMIVITMAYRWYVLGGPWEHIAYGILALCLCLWALRPNIKRLFRGEERLVGWRARRLQEAGAGKLGRKGD